MSSLASSVLIFKYDIVASLQGKENAATKILVVTLALPAARLRCGFG